MTIEKFESESATLKRFFELYCHSKHTDYSVKKVTVELLSKEKSSLEFDLCQECFDTINYSLDRLINCPHDTKPKCRTCESPCYEQKEWKKIAKIMRFSGMRLGLLKIKNIFS